jgi:hypothetical protein
MVFVVKEASTLPKEQLLLKKKRSSTMPTSHPMNTYYMAALHDHIIICRNMFSKVKVHASTELKLTM